MKQPARCTTEIVLSPITIDAPFDLYRELMMMSISLRDTRGWRCGHRCGGTGEKSPGPAQRPCKRSSLPRNLRLELEFLLRGLECLLVIGREGLHRGPVTRGANTRLRIQHKGLARPLSLYLRSVGGDLSRRSRCCVRLGVCERERGCARESRVPRVPAPVQSGCPGCDPTTYQPRRPQ